MSGVGRPRALTPQMERQLDRLLAAGVTQGVAARAVGVSRRTVQRQVKDRRDGSSPVEFDELIEQASASVDLTLAELRARWSSDV